MNFTSTVYTYQMGQEAATYYADNFSLIIGGFVNRSIKYNLPSIKSNFGFITQTILKLENASFSLDESLESVKNTKLKLDQNKGTIVEKINKKLKNVSEKNTRLKSIFMIRNILYDNNLDGDFPNLTTGK